MTQEPTETTAVKPKKHHRKSISGGVLLLLIIAIFVGYNYWLRRVANVEELRVNDSQITRPLIEKQNSVIRILSIQGGGMYGIIPLHALMYLEQKTGKPISQLFDVMMGTSTGTIPIMMLSTPNAQGQPQYTAQQTLSFYNNNAKQIFYNPWYNQLLTLDGLIGPKYLSGSRQSFIKSKLGDIRFDQLLNNVIIPSYNLKTQAPQLSYNWKQEQGNNDNFYARDLLLGATSPPYFFAPTIIYSLNHNQYILTDAAIYMNNPDLVALLEARAAFPHHQKFLLVSLGTGSNELPIIGQQTACWGMLQWILKILPLSIYADSQLNNEMVYKYFVRDQQVNNEQNYYHFNIKIPGFRKPMDDTSSDQIKNLNALGEKMVQANQANLDEVATRLMNDQ